MKVQSLVIVALLAMVAAAEAKYVYPEGSSTTSERRVNRRMKNYDLDKNDTLSLEEYQKYREVRTVDERRQERRAKRKGTYISPEDAFQMMDTDGDGKVSKEEMMQYEKSVK